MKIKNVLRFCLGIGLGVLISMSTQDKETEIPEVKVMEMEYMVDTRDIISYEETETGMLLNLVDGTGYYIENIENITEYVYPICDVITTYGKDYPTKLGVGMPDGSIHDFDIEDPPKEVELVCFKTSNQDNYKSYEVVGVR